MRFAVTSVFAQTIVIRGSEEKRSRCDQGWLAWYLEASLTLTISSAVVLRGLKILKAAVRLFLFLLIMLNPNNTIYVQEFTRGGGVPTSCHVKENAVSKNKQKPAKISFPFPIIRNMMELSLFVIQKPCIANVCLWKRVKIRKLHGSITPKPQCLLWWYQ